MLNLDAVRNYQRQIGSELPLNVDFISRQFDSNQRQHLAHDVIDVVWRFSATRFFRETPHTFSYFSGAKGVGNDAVDSLPHLFKIRFIAGEEMQAGMSVGDDGAERLIDFVSNGSG